MTKIRISTNNVKPGLKQSSPEVQFIRSVSGRNFSASLSAIETGEYFYEAELFLNDHVEVDEQIRDILHGLNKLNLGCKIQEISFSDDWDKVSDDDVFILEQDVLVNMLNESQGKFS